MPSAGWASGGKNFSSGMRRGDVQFPLLSNRLIYRSHPRPRRLEIHAKHKDPSSPVTKRGFQSMLRELIASGSRGVQALPASPEAVQRLTSALSGSPTAA